MKLAMVSRVTLLMIESALAFTGLLSAYNMATVDTDQFRKEMQEVNANIEKRMKALDWAEKFKITYQKLKM